MSVRLIVLCAVIVAFGALSALALKDVGYFGIIAPHFTSWGEGQVLADLVIMCILGCIWMIGDAKKHGLAAWPFIAITLVAGSFGPLLYLVARSVVRRPVAAVGAAA